MRRMVAVLLVVLLAMPASGARAQQVSPALLKAARKAYQQEQQKQSEMLALALAQPQAPAPSESDWNNLRQLRVGERIAVKTKDNIMHSGDFVAYSDEAISLREGKREVAYRRPTVLEVSLLGKRKRGKAALIGGLVGYVLGAGIGVALSGKGDISGEGILVMAVIGGSIGAGVGAGVARRSQTVVYRAGP